MAKEVFVPKLGQTVEEVTIVKWLVPDGSKVEQGQEIMEVETDKAVFAVEAASKGTLRIGPYPEGTVVPVLTVVAVIGKPDESYAGYMAQQVGGAAGESPAARDALVPEAAPSEGEVSSTGVDWPEGRVETPSTAPGRVFVSPRARKLAVERGVDLRRVTPTGNAGQRVVEKDVLAYLAQMPKATPLAQKVAAEAGVDLRSVTASEGGRITRSDVERTMQPATHAPAAVTEPTPAVAAPVPSFGTVDTSAIPEVTKRVPLTGVRKVIAERMGTSVHTTARVTLVMEVDATEFVQMRERLKAVVTEAWGFAPGYNDLLAKVVATSLRQFPYMNARIMPDAIEQLGHVNMGMAVDTERGLLVPVIRDADRKGVRQFGTEFRQLVDRARAGRSLPDDLAGGTFTITNLGMHDIDAFTPVINMPEAAILGVGRIVPKWVFRAESPDKPVLRQMWTLSLVFDHRLVDGAPAARFLQHIKGLIEEPYLLLAA